MIEMTARYAYATYELSDGLATPILAWPERTVAVACRGILGGVRPRSGRRPATRTANFRDLRDEFYLE